MIRSAVDQEFRTVVGTVCCHAHIYTDTVAASEELQDMTERFFRELRERLTAAGLLKTDPALGREPTREGAGPLRRPPAGVPICGVKGHPAGSRAGVRCTRRKGHKGYHEHSRGDGPRVRWLGYHAAPGKAPR